MILKNTGMCQQLRFALSMMVTISLANCSASESVSCDNPSGRILTSIIFTTYSSCSCYGYHLCYYYYDYYCYFMVSLMFFIFDIIK